jgi:hypothetical protein
MLAECRRVVVGVSVALIVASVPAAALAWSARSASSPQPPGWALRGGYSPLIDPAMFVARVDNRFFPLEPGTGFHYRGVREATPQTDDMVVTRRSKDVLGVRCTVVRDTVSEHGRPVERTFDWYAQDKHGNVWYMGEESLELRNGRFVRAGDSWEAGINGAKPGIIMLGDPRPGGVYRQEYYRPGGALDQARVLGRSPSMQVPAGTFKRPLVTIEWSPVEPQFEKKYYVAGIGEIAEQVVQGGHERFQLVRITH